MIQPIVLRNLHIPAEPRNWQPFRAGVEAHIIYGQPGRGPAAALLKYQPGADLAEHHHEGYEHILVLEGAQMDSDGTYEAGTLYVSPPGSRHSVSSPAGCIVLAIWEKPVVIVDAAKP